MKKYIIIVAGGKGLRMGGEIPKQFLPIQGKPVLMRTIETFIQYDQNISVILVLPLDHQQYWKELCGQYQFTLPYQMACGGETRFHSVKNGLEYVEKNSLVGVHDGVRPFVASDVIARCYQMAQTHNAVVPVIPVYETVREIEGKTSKTRDRNKYRLVQTPQVFKSTLLKQAYEQQYGEQFTDDASVVEAIDIPVFLTEGNRENIKITTPFDIKIANALINV